MAATKTAAEALDLDEYVGTVTAGKLADLPIVDGDPLTEPRLLSTPAASGWSCSGASRWPARPWPARPLADLQAATSTQHERQDMRHRYGFASVPT